MLLRRLAEAIRNQNWFTVLIEVLVVVVGIFLALQVDGWNETRKDRNLERRFLERLSDELTLDIGGWNSGLEVAWERREMGQLLLRSLVDPNAVREDPTKFVTAIEQAGWTMIPVVNDSTYEEIKFSGMLGIIRNEDLRQSITGYYKLIERDQQWNYVRESAQVTYTNTANGILTPEQIRKIENIWREDDPTRPSGDWKFTTEEAEEALARLRGNQEFIDQIPRGASKGDEIYNFSAWLQAATTLREDINEELGRVNN